MPRTKIYILITILTAIALTLLLIRVISPSQEGPITVPIPTPSPDIPGTTNFLVYDEELLEKDYQRITQRKNLSTQDTTIKNRLINSLPTNSNIVNQGNTYKIEYTKGIEVFMIEIINQDADKAKQDAMNWLKQQGLSQEGICNLPVAFYLNAQVHELYEQNRKQFNPIPDGC